MLWVDGELLGGDRSIKDSVFSIGYVAHAFLLNILELHWGARIERAKEEKERDGEWYWTTFLFREARRLARLCVTIQAVVSTKGDRAWGQDQCG